MATSSIIEPITIEDPEFLEAGCITDPEEIRRFAEKFLGEKID